MNKTAVVTGGAGFIGSHLVERLLRDGYQVRVLDNFSTGRPQNLAHLGHHKELHVHQVDIAEGSELPPFFEGADSVFHLAALADIVPSIERPLDYHRANVDGTVNVLEAARHAGVKRFIYAASSSCYGIPDTYPTPETAEIRPQYPYALTKWLGECYTLHWGKTYGLPVVSTRFFNVYGPRSRTSGTYGAVFGVFLAQKLARKPLTVVGDGSQTRDFTFVTDVADALVAAANANVSNVVLNVGSGNTYSINRLVELLEPSAGIVHLPRRPGEPDCTLADISLIRNTLGWTPQISLEIGVKIMLEHIQDWRSAPVWDPASIGEATEQWFRYLGQERA